MNKGIILTAGICLMLLSGCSGSELSSESAASQAVTTTAASKKTTDTSSQAESETPHETMRITAEAKEYKDGVFTFEYEGKEYSLPFDAENFVNSNYHLTDIGINEKIINNKFGIPIKADMEITTDMTEIVKCDVETVNGARYITDELETVYHMYPYKGSVYKIACKENTFYVDLNAFKSIRKTVLPENEAVGFDGVILDNDKLITNRLLLVEERRTKADENDQPGVSHIGLGNNLKYHYLGTVISVTDDKQRSGSIIRAKR